MIARLAPLLALAACYPKPVAPLPPPISREPCQPANLTALLGRPASAILAADALSQSGARELRWIWPEEAVTMDFRPDRLNARLDRRGLVREFTCG